MDTDPSAIIEHEGEVMSRADLDSLNYDVHEPFVAEPMEDHSVFAQAAAKAAGRLVEVAEDKGAQPSVAEQLYDALMMNVDRAVDQGRDRVAALENLDPGGKIRKAWQREEEQRAHKVVEDTQKDIQEDLLERRIAQRMQTLPIDKRDAERHHMLAADRARRERRGLRA